MAKYDSTLDHLFTALGDPTRRAVLNRLARGQASVGELAAPHDMALPSFLAHLKKLEDAGLITTAKQGRTRSCAMAPDGLVPAQDWMHAQRALWAGRLDRLDDYAVTLIKEKNNGPGPQD